MKTVKLVCYLVVFMFALLVVGCSQQGEKNIGGNTTNSDIVQSSTGQADDNSVTSPNVVQPTSEQANNNSVSSPNQVQQSSSQVVPAIPKVQVGKTLSDAHYQLIFKAEKAFWAVSHSLANNQFVERGTWSYGLLGSSYNSPAKITTYFEAFWSPEIASRMKNNLDLQVINGKYYCRVGDFTSIEPVQTKSKYTSQTNNTVTISAIVTYGNYPKEYPLTYKLKWTGKRWQIIYRNSALDLNNFIYK